MDHCCKSYGKSGNLIIRLCENIQETYIRKGYEVALSPAENNSLKISISNNNLLTSMIFKELPPDLEIKAFSSSSPDEDIILKDLWNYIDSFISLYSIESPGSTTKLVPKFCTQCGLPLKETMKFCTRCGKEIIWH